MSQDIDFKVILFSMRCEQLYTWDGYVLVAIYEWLPAELVKFYHIVATDQWFPLELNVFYHIVTTI